MEKFSSVYVDLDDPVTFQVLLYKIKMVTVTILPYNNRIVLWHQVLLFSNGK